MRGLRLFTLVALFIFLASIPYYTAAQGIADPSPPLVGGEAPTVLVSHDVEEIYLQGAKVWFWYDLPCIPGFAAGDYRLSEVSRIATTGGMTRTVWFHETEDPGCRVAEQEAAQFDDELLSNVIADEEYLYWMSNDANGLVRLSVEANLGDPVTPLYTGQANAMEIEDHGTYVYLIDTAYGIVRVDKGTGVGTLLVGVGQVGVNPRELQISDEYIFWNANDGARYVPIGGGAVEEIAENVSAYVAENTLCLEGEPCPTSEYVFIGQNGNIRRYNVDLGTLAGVLYNSPAPSAVITGLQVDGDNLYWFEERTTTCEPSCQSIYSLWRMVRTGGTAELLYTSEIDLYGLTDPKPLLGGPESNYLFWTDNDENEEGTLKRLPKDADEIPAIDIDITAIEVSQAIQDLDNSIQLIRDKRTGVRVHVDAAGQAVAGVIAELYRINGSGTVIDGPLVPSAGTGFLTVPNNPSRDVFNHAFYFELPQDWVDDNSLRLRAVVNPIQLPPEPNYANNLEDTATFTMRESPTLRTHLIVWGYTVDGTYYEPDLVQDVYQAKSWIMRNYPLASTTGGYESPDPGFRLAMRTINDPNLGDYVQRISEECLAEDEDIREFCAAAYTNYYAQELRIAEGIPEDELIYNMIWHENQVLEFPRGFATGSVSAGPTGVKSYGWDYDGSSGDWYMGHEVGHTVGRKHPDDENADDPNTDYQDGCGHSPSDPDFPYDHTEIGSDSMWGLDVGDVGLNSALLPQVYSNEDWTDFMGYCNRQWVSDYTYEGIYEYLSNPRPINDPAPARAGDAYIAIFGSIDADESPNARFQRVGLWDAPGTYTPPTGSAYELRFLNTGGTELASHAFDAEATDGSEIWLGYQVVVPFPLDTRTIQILDTDSGAVIGTHTVSANAPVVSNVALVNPPTPVTGIQTLVWNASDADGDELTFDVYYSDDGGANYSAFALGLDVPTVQVDTSTLPGSNTGIFRVIAGDGARRAEAESPTYDVADKAPTITFMNPQEGVEVRYGTQVNFTVEVQDLQGHVPDANLDWFVNGNIRTDAGGPFFTAEMLPVGENTIAVRATNPQGMSTTKEITVWVNDDTDYPDPTLIAGPSQLGWHLGVGSTTATPQTLVVGNSGTGTIAWTASENVDWLSLSNGSGNNEGVITVTADPTEATPGVALNTVITIRGDNGQTLEIPVSLLVGVSEAWFPPASAPNSGYEMYLPLVRRN